MWHRPKYCLLILLIAISFVACGDSDDEEADQPTKTTSPTISQTTPADDTENVVREEIDLDAEEAAAREAFDAHTAALRVGAKNLDEVMDIWLKLETKDVFMAQDVAGALNIIEGWKAVKTSWESTWKRLGSVPIPTTITALGVDKKAQNATVSGTYSWAGGTNPSCYLENPWIFR